MTRLLTHLLTRAKSRDASASKNSFPQAGRIALFENGKKYFDKTGMKVVGRNSNLYKCACATTYFLCRTCKTLMRQTQSR